MMEFQPADPDYAARARANFYSQNAMAHLGADVISVGPGRMELTMPFADTLTQQHGYIHGGLIASVLDSACGFAALTLMPIGAEVLTIEFKVNFLRPAKADKFRFVGEVIKAGRSIMVCEGRAFSILGDKEKLMTTMNGSMMVALDRPDLTST